MKIKKYNYIAKYWRQIQDGDVLVSEKVKKTMQMLIDIQEGKDPKYHFDPVLANRPIVFIESFCKQSKGAVGKPIKLELFQKVQLQAIYGIVDKHKLRRFTEVFIKEGRKNGKSTQLSGQGCFALLGDKEGGPEIDCISTKRDAARIVFNSAKNMVLQSPELRKYIEPKKVEMTCAYNFGTFQPLSSDSNTLDGLNPSMVVLDECHAIKDRNIYDVMRQSISAETRKQPLFMIITTMGFNRDGIFDELDQYATDVLNGDVEDEHFLSFCYELDAGDEWDDESVWIKANPGLGTIKSLEKMRQGCAKAKASPQYKKTFLVKDLNRAASEVSSWLNFEQIDNPATFDMEKIYNSYAIGGCDLSTIRDLTAATLIIRVKGDSTIYQLQHYFIPEEKMREIEESNVKEAPYRKWEERGLLTICPGAMVQYSLVTEWFKKMRDEHKITLWRCGYDRALADYWVQEMKMEFGDVMEAVAQGPITWTAPMNEMGAMLSEKRINYNNNPIFKWCLSNTGVKTTGTNEAIQPVKIQQKRRIDGMVSSLNAIVIYCKYRDDYLNTVG